MVLFTEIYSVWKILPQHNYPSKVSPSIFTKNNLYMSPARNQQDTAYCVETPEGIDIEVQLAGPIPRILAYGIDLLIRIAVLLVISIILAFLGRMGAGIFLVISFLMEWFYPVFFEVYKQGQTPGKKRLGLVVVHEDLTPIAWGASMTRNLLRTADFLPFAYIFGLVSMCSGKRFQRLGDIAAGSLVIHQSVTEHNDTLPKLSPIVSPVALELEDQVAIINFVRRHDRLTTARKQELAKIVHAVTQNSARYSENVEHFESPYSVTNIDDEANNAVKRLQAIGIWLLGAR